MVSRVVHAKGVSLAIRGGAGNSLEKCFLNRFDQWSRHMCICVLPIRANVSGSARR